MALQLIPNPFAETNLFAVQIELSVFFNYLKCDLSHFRGIGVVEDTPSHPNGSWPRSGGKQPFNKPQKNPKLKVGFSI